LHRRRCRPMLFRRKSLAGSWQRLRRVCSPGAEAAGLRDHARADSADDLLVRVRRQFVGPPDGDFVHDRADDGRPADEAEAIREARNLNAVGQPDAVGIPSRDQSLQRGARAQDRIRSRG
jgi:hypothetical protein